MDWFMGVYRMIQYWLQLFYWTDAVMLSPMKYNVYQSIQ